jgi:hypothetical protein
VANGNVYLRLSGILVAPGERAGPGGPGYKAQPVASMQQQQTLKQVSTLVEVAGCVTCYQWLEPRAWVQEEAVSRSICARSRHLFGPLPHTKYASLSRTWCVYYQTAVPREAVVTAATDQPLRCRADILEDSQTGRLLRRGPTCLTQGEQQQLPPWSSTHPSSSSAHSSTCSSSHRLVKQHGHSQTAIPAVTLRCCTCVLHKLRNCIASS